MKTKSTVSEVERPLHENVGKSLNIRFAVAKNVEISLSAVHKIMRDADNFSSKTVTELLRADETRRRFC